MTDLHDESHEAEEDPSPEDDRRWDTGTFVTGVLIGALLGAGVALLLAPGSGAETRRLIRRKARGLSRDAKAGLESARDEAREALREKKEALRERLVKGLDQVGERLGV